MFAVDQHFLRRVNFPSTDCSGANVIFVFCIHIPYQLDTTIAEITKDSSASDEAPVILYPVVKNDYE
jgi:hypothetical protein